MHFVAMFAPGEHGARYGGNDKHHVACTPEDALRPEAKERLKNYRVRQQTRKASGVAGSEQKIGIGGVGAA